MNRPQRKRGSTALSIDGLPSTPGPQTPLATDQSGQPGMFVKRFTLTSKPNWWLVEVNDDDDQAQSEDTLVTRPSTPSTEASATVYTPAANHPTQLFQFPTPPAYSAPPNPTSHLSPFASGSTSELFRCIIKKPEVTQIEINGELQSNLDDVRTQFLAELRVYRTVARHRNIIAFLGCLEGLGMVLEYVEGSPLLDVIRDASAPLVRETKVDFHNQLLAGLSHVHSFGLSHGDLSLLNVHVTKKSSTLKILDFGRSTAAPSFIASSYSRSPEMSFQPAPKRQRSSRLMSQPQTPGGMTPFSGEREEIHPGTRPFTAPEVLRGDCKDPLLADAYSLGVILLCLDLNGLVDIDPERQKKDERVDTSGCEIFSARIGWYTSHWRERRTVRKEDRMLK